MAEIIGNDPIIQTTRKGHEIPLEPGFFATLQEVQGQLNYLNGWIANHYRDRSQKLRQRKPATGMYNCHGLTFLSRRAWLTGTPGINIVLKDDDYYEITEENVLPGDVVIYFEEVFGRTDIAHTGVVTRIDNSGGSGNLILSKTIWVLSKWASGPEYEHPHDGCPYPMNKITYWREGKNDEVTDLRPNRNWRSA